MLNKTELAQGAPYTISPELARDGWVKAGMGLKNAGSDFDTVAQPFSKEHSLCNCILTGQFCSLNKNDVDWSTMRGLTAICRRNSIFILKMLLYTARKIVRCEQFSQIEVTILKGRIQALRTVFLHWRYRLASRWFKALLALFSRRLKGLYDTP